MNILQLNVSSFLPLSFVYNKFVIICFFQGRYGQKISIQVIITSTFEFIFCHFKAENARTFVDTVNHISAGKSPAELLAAMMLRRADDKR